MIQGELDPSKLVKQCRMSIAVVFTSILIFREKKQWSQRRLQTESCRMIGPNRSHLDLERRHTLRFDEFQFSGRVKNEPFQIYL